MTVDELKIAALALSEEDFQGFLQQLFEAAPLMRVNALVKHLENAWDVSAAGAPVMMAGPAGGGAGDDGGAAEVVQTEFDVILKEAGEAKLNVIKVVREITGLGIKEAKTLVDSAPTPIKEKVSKAEADDLVKKLHEAGAVAELK